MLERMKRVVVNKNADRTLCRQKVGQVLDDACERVFWRNFGETTILVHRRPFESCSFQHRPALEKAVASMSIKT
jgi:hypothetical protein